MMVKLAIATMVGIKIFLKYVKNLLSKEEMNTIIDNAALVWATTGVRRNGAGSF